MSNSTLPLGFLHSNTELVTCGQLLYFPILGQRKLSRVFHSGRSNEIHLFDQFTANLHFVVRVNYKFRLPVCVDEAFSIVVKIHLKTILRKSYQVGIGYH